LLALSPPSVETGGVLTLEMANVSSAHVSRAIVGEQECDIVARPSNTSLVCRLARANLVAPVSLRAHIINLIGRTSRDDVTVTVLPQPQQQRVIEIPSSRVPGVGGTRQPGVHTSIDVQWRLDEAAPGTVADSFVLVMSNTRDEVEAVATMGRRAMEETRWGDWTVANVLSLPRMVVRTVPRSLCQQSETIECVGLVDGVTPFPYYVAIIPVLND
jgi:hypothetical protein